MNAVEHRHQIYVAGVIEYFIHTHRPDSYTDRFYSHDVQPQTAYQVKMPRPRKNAAKLQVAK